MFLKCFSLSGVYHISSLLSPVIVLRCLIKILLWWVIYNLFIWIIEKLINIGAFLITKVLTIYTCNISHLDIHVFTHSVFISPLCLLCKSVTFIVQYHTLDLIIRNQHKLRASARLSPFISPGPYNVPWITLQESQMTSINNWVFFSYLVNYNFVKNMLLTVIWMCDCCCYFPGLLEKIICVHKRLSLVLSTEKLNLKFSTNKNKRHYGKVWNLFLIVQLIFFLSDSVFTHPFNTKRLYMYLFLYWILIKKTIQTFS